MISLSWSYSVALLFVTAAGSTELVPERFLRPRNFNHHPFTDVGGPPAPKPLAVLSQSNPYAVLSQKKPREGREFARQDVIFYPSPHPSVLPPKKYLETNEIGGGYDDPYLNIPKNYAFSYIVKDHQSGDDFSHSQAHNGKATRGQYRVKLPDGRIQIVSYTADHKGYRADVQYEEDDGGKPGRIIPSTQISKPSIDYNEEIERGTRYRLLTAYDPRTPNRLGANPVPANGYLNLILTSSSPKPNGNVDYSDYLNNYLPSTTPRFNERFASSTPRYDESYRREIINATPAPYLNQQFSPAPNYKLIPSPTPNHVIVTPRTILNSVAVGNSNHDARQHIVYKYV